VTSLEFRDRLARRTRRAKAPITLPMLAPLEAYYRLLAHWNAKINLTALPLDNPTDETFDRLLVEPLCAAREIDRLMAVSRLAANPSWIDLGSGGGSPAIPLKIARPFLRLTMVESKERKSAFLREAIRLLAFRAADVLTQRFEELAGDSAFAHAFDFLSARAVKADDVLLATAAGLLKPNGHMLLFRPSHAAGSNPVGFVQVKTVQLTDSPPSFLCAYRRVFHVEQSR
jgi:16S rRNA (guanine527-N7)-methyltransferase